MAQTQSSCVLHPSLTRWIFSLLAICEPVAEPKKMSSTFYGMWRQLLTALTEKLWCQPPVQKQRSSCSLQPDPFSYKFKRFSSQSDEGAEDFEMRRLWRGKQLARRSLQQQRVKHGCRHLLDAIPVFVLQALISTSTGQRVMLTLALVRRT